MKNNIEITNSAEVYLKKLIDGKIHYSDVKAKGTYPHNEYISIRDIASSKSTKPK